MDLESVEKLTEALQTTSEPTNNQPVEETSATISDITADTDKADVASLRQEEEKAIKSNVTTEPTSSTQSVNTETKPDETPVSTTENNDTSATATNIQPNAQVKAKKEEDTAPVSKTVAPSPQTPEVIRKPLEVIQSDIPPLRPESIPRRTHPSPEDEQTVEGFQATTEIIEEDTVAVCNTNFL